MKIINSHIFKVLSKDITDKLKQETKVNSHIPYEHVRNRECDFIVQYRFFSEEEGGRKTVNPIQGYRSDFMYSGDENLKQLWMIWPEFLDNENNIILDKSIRVSTSGKAKMWILNETLYELHKDRIKRFFYGRTP
ncbi:hypothetical protein KHA90_05385 [Flavobacterium psychroterrae]|uniref:Uncharacterized protein n=1 Tax=Flavobacterium psychroterrae TaxID=2133767 RepID=A0ABS5P9N0_9FLAO|nr:hypothetical protein [Flavobacterium psychroterrae]MBS7230451.1 hypothetical protein [Flavobacterium psychroterrae]